MAKFSITLKELEKAVEFAKENGESKFKTIAIEVSDSGIGHIFLVSKNYDSEQINITDYECW